MDAKGFSEYLTNLQKQFAYYFQKREQEENTSLDALFSELKQSFSGGEEAIASRSEEIKTGAEAFDRERDRLSRQIEDLRAIDIDKASGLIKKKTNIRNKNIYNSLLANRRKKHTVNYKISNLERNLAQKVKENADIINEEQRNYKAREAEFLRRQNIDILRAQDVNTKEYGEIEKTLLQTNDIKGISEAKRRIKKIRAAGLRNQAGIKNKYAHLIYSNELSYYKFYEKKLYERNLIEEDFSIKIKALEAEKKEIEYLELLYESALRAEAEKEMLALERENNRASLKARCNIREQVLDLKKQIVKNTVGKYEFIKTKIAETEVNVGNFDDGQLKKHAEYKKTSCEDLADDVTFFLELYNSFTRAVFHKIYHYLSEKYRRRGRLIDDVKQHLLTANNKQCYESVFKYETIINDINKLLNDHEKEQNVRFESLLAIVARQSLLVYKQITLAFREIKHWLVNEEEALNIFGKNCSDILADGIKNSIGANEDHIANIVEGIESEYGDIEKEQSENEHFLKYEEKAIDDGHNRAGLAIDEKLNREQEYLRQNIVAVHKAHGTYKKKGRIRTSRYRNDYQQNIIAHEKQTYKKYKATLANIESEREQKYKTL